MQQQFSQSTTDNVSIPLAKLSLQGNLTLPVNAKSLIVFAHGSGSTRFSPRNQYVAQVLHDEGMGTLLFDLLSKEEEKVDNITRELRFNIPLLAERLVGVTEWIEKQRQLASLSLGYFGASTGAAAALLASASLPGTVKAVVCRGGRPDLAGSALPRVTAATLLIVGGDDYGVIELNESASNALTCEKSLAIVPGATHLFEEPGKLEEVAQLAGAWFKEHLT